jgi:uncharacterized protein (DUF58 family)
VTATQPPDRPRDGRAVAVYTLARVGLCILCLLLAWVAGLTGLLLLVAALLVSGVLSWFLLQRQRLAMSGAVERTMTRVRRRLDDGAAAEDSYVDGLEQQRSSADR